MARGAAVPPAMAKGSTTPCMAEDPETMFPDERGGGDAVARARAVCKRCPLKKDCLEHALRVPEEFGMWGGTTARQRRIIRKRYGWP